MENTHTYSKSYTRKNEFPTCPSNSKRRKPCPR
jgi:hypothetical protein